MSDKRSTWSYIKDISQGKHTFDDGYNKHHINSFLSHFICYTQLSVMLSSCTDQMSDENHYDLVFETCKGYNFKYPPFAKRFVEFGDKEVRDISTYYKYSYREAEQVVNYFTEKELQEISKEIKLYGLE